MTERGYQILHEINLAVQRQGFPPSVRELCVTLGLASTSTVHTHLANLEAEGLIVRQRDKNRAITITTLGLSALLKEALSA